ncbi:hypothetical protein Bca4012_102967 [Brassica carinata]
MRDEPKPGYGAQLRANLEPTKGVGRQDSRTVVMEVEPLRRREPGGAAAGADLGGSSKYSNENFEGRRGERFHVNGTCTWGVRDAGRNSKELSFLFNSLPTPETAQPEVGSSGWKSTARRVVSVHSRALENRGPKAATPGRIHNRIRSPRAGLGVPVQPADCWRLLEPLTWRATASCRPGTDWERLFRAFPRRTANSELCSECQSEEIQPSAVNGGVTMTLLSQGNGLGRISGKEDPVELDSSPTL